MASVLRVVDGWVTLHPYSSSPSLQLYYIQQVLPIVYRFALGYDSVRYVLLFGQVILFIEGNHLIIDSTGRTNDPSFKDKERQVSCDKTNTLRELTY